MKFGLCQELFGERPWSDQCRTMAELGYHGVEIAPFTLASRVTELSSERRRSLRAEAEAHGLEVIGLHWLLAKTEGLHLTTDDEAVRRATSQYLADLANCCADLGGKILVFGSPMQRSLETGMSKVRASENAAEVLRGALPACADRGVTIALEPLTPKETNFLNTCDEAVLLMERVDHPNLRLHQDVKAMLGGERESIPALIAKHAKNTVHFHANDSNLLGPGMGETDFAPIFEALLRSGYDGYVSVEVFDYSPGADTIARVSIETMRGALDAARRRENSSS
ncbi:MAG: sugar phosphate isomerase/epimerase family protein [Planctomycetaceae bacterium]